MFNRKATFSRLGAGLAVVAILGFVGSAPAGAAAGDILYTASQPDATYTLGTIDKSTLAFTALGPAAPENIDVHGIDVFGEIGYAVGFDSDLDSHVVFSWNRTTGAIGTPVALTQTILLDEAFRVYGADTLADGTLLTILDFDSGSTYVVSVDLVTGVLTELVDITDSSDFIDSIATDPTTATTYVMVDEDDGLPEYLTLDLDAGTYTGPTGLPVIQEELGNGYMNGADFDSDGILWFYYGPDIASTTGPFGPTVSAVGSGAADLPESIDTINLTVGTAIVPVLAATGLPIAVIGAGAAALLGAGLAAFFVTRRRAEV